MIYTDEAQYIGAKDTIHVTLENNSITDMSFLLRCNYWPENVYYQIFKNGNWSQNISFSYMYLKCPSLPFTLYSFSNYDYTLITSEFDSPGTYRLVLDSNNAIKDTINNIYSNSFIITASQFTEY
ncbi:MAG: hypothetical protein P8X42_12025 [Calditrichaceae bacterium]